MDNQPQLLPGVDPKTENIVWGLVLIIVLFIVLALNPIVAAIPWGIIKIGEVKFFSLFSFLYSDESNQFLQKLDYHLKQTSFASLDWTNMYNVERKLFRIYGWIYPAILLLLGIALYRRHTKTWDRIHSVDSLLEEQSEYYRFNRHLVNNNPFNDSKDITKGKYRIREKVAPYLIRKKIVSLRKSEGTPQLHFDKEAYSALLKEQIGKRFPGVDGLNQIEKRVFAILGMSLLDNVEVNGFYEKFVVWFNRGKKREYIEVCLKPISWYFQIPRVIKKRVLSAKNLKPLERRQKLLGDLSYAYNSEMSFEDVDADVERYCRQIEVCDVFKELSKQHFFTRTLFRRLLKEARNNGVFPTKLFSWLKAEDRLLWYTLNDLGIPESSVEVHGVKSHYDFEYALQKMQPTARINKALEHAEIYVEEKRALFMSYLDNEQDEFKRWNCEE